MKIAAPVRMMPGSNTESHCDECYSCSVSLLIPLIMLERYKNIQHSVCCMLSVVVLLTSQLHQAGNTN
jgi:hypothetical protein